MPVKRPDTEKTKDAMNSMFATKSYAWAEVGLAGQVAAQAARKARRQAVLFIFLIAAVLVVYANRARIFGEAADTWVRIATVVALVIIGWAFARDLGRAAGPALFRRMDPATAGTVGFLLRLVTLLVLALVALRIAGLRPETLAVGGAFTAVVLGLAAQQTLGNLFAGTVLLSARPFRVGERVRFQGGGVAGQVEGVVSSLGLLYTVLASGEDRIMVPNSVVLALAVMPLREPNAVDLTARLPLDTRPSELQSRIHSVVDVPTRSPIDIELEQVDGDEVVVRIKATPESAADGPKLADEILSAVTGLTGNAGGGGGGSSSSSGNPRPAGQAAGVGGE